MLPNNNNATKDAPDCLDYRFQFIVELTKEEKAELLAMWEKYKIDQSISI